MVAELTDAPADLGTAAVLIVVAMGAADLGSPRALSSIAFSAYSLIYTHKSSMTTSSADIHTHLREFQLVQVRHMRKNVLLAQTFPQHPQTLECTVAHCWVGLASVLR